MDTAATPAGGMPLLLLNERFSWSQQFLLIEK
jgi:hypothetical protein